MSLSASMWTSVSGLLAHGQRMNTIGNNISNINTVGFKGSRMDFQDILYSSTASVYGNGQIGGGTGIGIIMNNFSQGSFETTTSVLDIAISGNGFFKVSPIGSDQNFYTRAGNFSTTKEGYVVDSNGFVLQGWSLGGTTRGVVQDIKLDTGACPPKHTTEVAIQINLPTTNVSDNTEDSSGTDPFFALLNTWDATQNPPLAESAWAFQTSMEVYDEGGTLHILTVYFDRVITDVSDPNGGETYWEYVVTMDPGEDLRDFSSNVGDTTTSPDVPDRLKGLLGAGTITFNSTGQMTNMTCYVPQADSVAPSAWWTGAPGSETVSLGGWVAAPTTTDGYPLICPNFSGSAGLSNAYLPGVYTQPNQYAQGRLIALDLGLSSSTGNWNYSNAGAGAGGLNTAAQVGTKKDNILGFGTSFDRSNTAMTSSDGGYVEYMLSQNGYASGYLTKLTVASNGVISGIYSNGKTLELYQVALYNFPSLQNLRHEGNNLFSETAESGMPVCGEPGTGQFGTTQSYRLEQSNVDLTTEFVNLIATQRGFQANSKTITTVDTMLETVIGMKR